MDQMEHSARSAAAERARAYRDQAQAFRNLAVTEPLEQKRKLLFLAANRFEGLAAAESLVANGRRREARMVAPKAPPSSAPPEARP